MATGSGQVDPFKNLQRAIGLVKVLDLYNRGICRHGSCRQSVISVRYKATNRHRLQRRVCLALRRNAAAYARSAFFGDALARHGAVGVGHTQQVRHQPQQRILFVRAAAVGQNHLPKRLDHI